VRADWTRNLDAGIVKSFHFTERHQVQVRGEAFSALN